MERKLFAVTGNPAARSLFPIAFRTFFKFSKSKDVYTRVVADSVQEAFASAKLVGLSGLNIACPFRMDATDVTEKSFRIVENIGSVNTVLFGSDGKIGYNSEFQSIQQFLFRIFGEKVGKVLILGTSPDAMAASCGFATAGWKVTVLGSTLSSAVECAVKCGGDAGELNTVKKHIDSAELVVCAGLGSGCTLDLKLIGRTPVLLLGCDEEFEARCVSLNIISNVDFILAQAATSYAIFTGTFPDENAMAAARAELEKNRKKKKIISFIGFASAGRSVCAKALSEKLGYSFVDLDSSDVPVDSICNSDDNVVFSSGFNKIFHQNNRQLIKEKTCPIWIVSTSELILKDEVFMQYSPQSGVSMIGKMERLFDEHKIVYAETSELIIRSDIRTPEETALRLMSELKEKNL